MRSWDISTLDVKAHQPEVLDSEAESRAIVIQLPAGERLQEHQVYEHASLLVVSGRVEIDAGGNTVEGGAGFLAVFDPNERREVKASEDSRLLLLLSPWPGVGHPSNRD